LITGGIGGRGTAWWNGSSRRGHFHLARHRAAQPDSRCPNAAYGPVDLTDEAAGSATTRACHRSSHRSTWGRYSCQADRSAALPGRSRSPSRPEPDHHVLLCRSDQGAAAGRRLPHRNGPLSRRVPPSAWRVRRVEGPVADSPGPRLGIPSDGILVNAVLLRSSIRPANRTAMPNANPDRAEACRARRTIRGSRRPRRATSGALMSGLRPADARVSPRPDADCPHGAFARLRRRLSYWVSNHPGSSGPASPAEPVRPSPSIARSASRVEWVSGRRYLLFLAYPIFYGKHAQRVVRAVVALVSTRAARGGGSRSPRPRSPRSTGAAPSRPAAPQSVL